MDDLHRKVYLYVIKFENIPVYIGSTTNIIERQKSHNKELKKARAKNTHTKFLYDFLRDKLHNIELQVISECYDDIVILSKNIFEYRRNIQEEKLITHCIKKGYVLLNMVYPSIFYMESEKLIQRDEKSKKILYTDNYNGDKITNEIIKYLKTKKEDNFYKDIDSKLFPNDELL